VLSRHPEVIVENCASGAMRADYAMLSRLDLQSTSDQQDLRRYAAVAAAAPAAVLPEQAGNWAYPQPGMPAEQIAFTLVNGLAGRLYLSGHLDKMDDRELGIVRAAVAVHKRIRDEVATAEPCWPLGLPGWDDDFVALGLRTGAALLLALWWRGGEPARLELDLPWLAGGELAIRTEFPAGLPDWMPRWDPGAGRLSVSPGAGPAARLLRLQVR
jgi:alpha-galactosidase